MLFAAALLIVTGPVVLLAALVVKLTSRGPAFYTQRRLGCNGRTFSIYKLRTMQHNCEAVSGPQWSVPGDARITPVGRFLRKTHIDELPQLWNVLRHDMSLVGPRPERPEIVATLVEFIPRYGERLRIRPGLTGLAQVQLPADTDLDSVRRKLAYDLYYIEQGSLGLDLRIVLATILYLAGISFSTLRGLCYLPVPDDLLSAVAPLEVGLDQVAGDYGFHRPAGRGGRLTISRAALQAESVGAVGGRTQRARSLAVESQSV